VPLFYLAKDKVNDWAKLLAEEHAVFFPALVQEKVHFRRFEAKLLSSGEKPVWALERIRAVEPVKAFLFAAREAVARFPDPAGLPDKHRKQVVIGAKACDLMPLRVAQKMFLEREREHAHLVDPFYQTRLNDTVFVSADCPVPESTCFCNLLGIPPYVDAGSDIVLTALEDGYLVEPISAVGRGLVFGRDKPFRPASEDEVHTRERLRRQAVAKLQETNPKPWRKDLPDGIDQKKDEKFWRDAGKDCVECYGCLMTCPTCFCYLLYDQGTADDRQDRQDRQEHQETLIAEGDNNQTPDPQPLTPDLEPRATSFDRIKVWDACYYEGYARVGGGTNARPKMWERFRNRFLCKWMNCPRDWGFHSCSGCGRCYAACMGKIDIRKILGSI
jgi:hypothetical protein